MDVGRRWDPPWPTRNKMVPDLPAKDGLDAMMPILKYSEIVSDNKCARVRLHTHDAENGIPW